jgi:uncharacterized glyoxalase superfamily protein PhnB
MLDLHYCPLCNSHHQEGDVKRDNLRFTSANPVMPVKNAKAAAAYYRDKFGFSIDVLWENPNYACVSRGGITIEMGEGRPTHVGSGVCYIRVDDADRLYNEFKSRKLIFVGDYADRVYGCRDFRVKDSDGNILIFGSALPKKDELIAKHNIA